VALVVAVEVRASGERIFHVGRHGSHQNGNVLGSFPKVTFNP
jgi:hypothetical protein